MLVCLLVYIESFLAFEKVLKFFDLNYNAMYCLKDLLSLLAVNLTHPDS